MDVVILNAAGNPVRTTLEEQRSLEHAGMWTQLMQKSKYAVQNIDPEDDVLFLRVRTKQHETIVTPDEKLTYVVVQNPQDRISVKPQGIALSKGSNESAGGRVI